MIDRGRGRVINVSSIGGMMTFPMMGAYHASKYAVEALSDALRMELAPFGIDVVVIQPGPIKTNFVARMNEGVAPYRQRSRYAATFARADKLEERTMAMAPGPEVILPRHLPRRHRAPTARPLRRAILRRPHAPRFAADAAPSP